MDPYYTASMRSVSGLRTGVVYSRARGLLELDTLNLSSGKGGSVSEDALCRVLVTSVFPEHRLVSATTSEESLRNHTSAAVTRSERLLGVAKSILKNHKSIDYGGPLGHCCRRSVSSCLGL